MKAIHSEEYYSKYHDQLMKKYGRLCNYEEQVQRHVPDLTMIPAEQRETVKNIIATDAARKIVSEATATLKQTMQTIKDINAGRASLGYTTAVQEISARHDVVEGFEFACYVLHLFKKKYNL